MPKISSSSVSLAPSSQSAVRESRTHTGVKRHEQLAVRSRPYDVGQRPKLKNASVQGDLEERPPAQMAPREDSLQYAQGLALHLPSRSSRTGGKFRCTLGQLPELDFLCRPLSSSNATGGFIANWKRLSAPRNPPPYFSDRT